MRSLAIREEKYSPGEETREASGPDRWSEGRGGGHRRSYAGFLIFRQHERRPDRYGAVILFDTRPRRQAWRNIASPSGPSMWSLNSSP